MTRKLARPAVDDVRCPSCGRVDWRRIGERVSVTERPDGERELSWEAAAAAPPWDWTCDRCGHAVRASSRLDKALGRVQPSRLPAFLGLLGLGSGAGVRNGSRAQQGVTLTLAVAAIAAAAVVLWLAPRTQPTTPVPASSPPVLSDVASIAANRGGGAAGAAVQLAAVRVAAVTGDTTFWVGDAADRALVVIDERRQPEGSVTVRPGQTVEVRGTAEREPPDGVSLSDGDRDALGEAGVYVLADHVVVVTAER